MKKARLVVIFAWSASTPTLKGAPVHLLSSYPTDQLCVSAKNNKIRLKNGKRPGDISPPVLRFSI